MIVQFILYSVFMFNCVWATSLLRPKSYLNDYAWRDFEGLIPDDAFIGGKDKLGAPIYIGQALYENKLIPGKIYQNDRNIYFEWRSKEYIQTRNIKILCTLTPNLFRWLATESDKLWLLTDKIVVNGGYEAPNFSVYLGRALIDGETVVGKVICRAQDCLGLYTTSNGVSKNLKKFEILTYDWESAASETTP